MRLERCYSADTRLDSDGGVWTRHLEGISVGSNGVGFCVGSGQVLRTVDYGSHWENLWVQESRTPYSHAQRVFCTELNECWIPSFAQSEVSYTADLGKSWNVVRLENGEVANDVFFSNSRTGWIASYKSVGRLRRTIDGGREWQIVQSFSDNPYNICFLNDMVGWALTRSENASFSKILSTHDGGDTWSESARFPGAYLGIHPLKENEVLLLGIKGEIHKSFDGGIAWEKVLSCEFTLNAIQFRKEKGFAVGDCGSLFFTSDNGENWRQHDSGIAENFIGIDVFDDGSAVIASTVSIFRLF